MHYSTEDEKMTLELMDHTAKYKLDHDKNPSTKKYFYEGFVKLFDGG